MTKWKRAVKIICFIIAALAVLLLIIYQSSSTLKKGRGTAFAIGTDS